MAKNATPNAASPFPVIPPASAPNVTIATTPSAGPNAVPGAEAEQDRLEQAFASQLHTTMLDPTPLRPKGPAGQ